MRVATFHHIATFSIHLLELIKNTSSRLEVSKVVTQINGSKTSVERRFGDTRHSSRRFAASHATASNNKVKITPYEVILKPLERSYYFLRICHTFKYIIYPTHKNKPR
jgi:hypothetical protein